MTTIRKKFTSVLALALSVTTLAFSLCGCYIGSAAKEKRKAHKTALKFFEYLKKEDIEKLTDLFSDNTEYDYDLEQEWEDFFDTIDGKIVSYGRLQVMDIEVWYEDYKVNHAIIRVDFRDVVTDEGVTYDMLSYNHVVKDVDKDAIGITVVELTDNDDNSLAVVGGVGE